jgi:3-oxoacyl-[acyl-carrier protein] reductase
MKQELNPQNNWIVISGVSRGLGLALSREFLELGWCVAGLSSTASSELEELKASFVDNFFWQQLDIGDSKAIDQAIEKAGRNFVDRNLWAVINNAGISIEGILATLPIVDIERVLQVNLTGAMVLARAGLRKMMQQKTAGRIINISSITGSRGYTGLSSYAASKAGLDGFTRALAREVGRLGITVNSIAPGYMQTALSQGLDEKQLMQIVRRTPLGRLCTLEDIVDLAEFLISPKASFITGQVLTVDGGLTN